MELFAELVEESVDLLVDVLGLLEDVAKVFASFSYKSRAGGETVQKAMRN